MRVITLRGALAGLCLLWTAGIAQAAQEIAWVKSLQAAMTQAKATNKLVMADFYTDWCGWCKRLDADTFSDRRVIQSSGQFVSVKINAEKEGVAAAKKYGVSGYPAILFIDPAGKVADKIGGYMPPTEFNLRLTQIADTRAKPALEARVKANANDVPAIARLAAVYAGQKDEARAVALMAQAEAKDPKNASGHLSKAYNAVGDHFQMKQDLEKAISYFQKAVGAGKDPGDLAYAHISIASCYLAQKKFPEAIPALEATIAVPNAPADLKGAAQQILDQVKKQGAS
jgi:thioredoxin-related protein